MHHKYFSKINTVSNPLFWLKQIVFVAFMTLFLWSCKSKNAANSEQQNKSDSLRLDSLLVDSLKVGGNFIIPKDANANLPINTRIDFYEHVLIHPNFEAIKMRSTIQIEMGNSIPALDAVVYIENHQKVWINLSYILNVARGIATNEGIKAYEKYNSTYIDSNFDYLNNLLNIDFFNYSTLQKLLMGRTFIPIKDSQFLLTQNKDGYYMISRKNQNLGTEQPNHTARSYQISLAFSTNFDLKKVVLMDVNSKDNLIIEYDNWQNFEQFRLPGNVKIIIKGHKNGQIVIENTKFETSKMQTPYSVPKNYKKIELND